MIVQQFLKVDGVDERTFAIDVAVDLDRLFNER